MNKEEINYCLEYFKNTKVGYQFSNGFVISFFKVFEQLNDLDERINKAIEYYETYKQECVIGRNKDEKLIKDYYLPAQCSKKLMEILKGE